MRDCKAELLLLLVVMMSLRRNKMGGKAEGWLIDISEQ